MANPFVHVELMTGDVDKAKAFYGSLFDWNLEDVPGMDYTIVKVGEMKEATEVPGMGRFGILVDPGGAAFALWQPRM